MCEMLDLFKNVMLVDIFISAVGRYTYIFLLEIMINQCSIWSGNVRRVYCFDSYPNKILIVLDVVFLNDIFYKFKNVFFKVVADELKINSW